MNFSSMCLKIDFSYRSLKKSIEQNFDLGYFPEKWTEGYIIPIQKG
jgi:hypothetical protein